MIFFLYGRLEGVHILTEYFLQLRIHSLPLWGKKREEIGILFIL